MERYIHHVDCPSFDEVDLDYRCGKSPLRRYCHPVDKKIIDVLDNPAINAVFGTVSDFGADQNFGQIIASAVPVNSNNYPREDEIVCSCSEKLNIRKPYTVISNVLPGINACTVGSDDEPYLILSSLLVKMLSKEQLKFVVGHECGHIAMGHVVYHSAVRTAGSFSRLIPVIGPVVFNTISFPLLAWERRSEITADRAGLICCEDLELAQRTLLQLESAFQNADNLDIDGYIESSRKYLKRGTVRKLGELTLNHPLIAKRMEALSVFAISECYFDIIGKEKPAGAISDQELEKNTESIISIL